jgi:hypothetical protein
MFGSQSYQITQIDGTNFSVYWDTVSQQNPFIKFTASSLDGIHAPDIASILSQLPTLFTPGVYQEINVNQLSTYVQEIDSNTLVTNSGISSTVSGSYLPKLVPSAKNYQFSIIASQVIITPMILSAPNATPTIDTSGLVTMMNVSLATSTNLVIKGLGGYGSLSYSVVSGPGSISVVGGQQVFSSSTAGTTVLQVTDSYPGSPNTAQLTVTIS